MLWEDREKSGDFTVKSKKDGKEKKYHKIVLFYLPFFKALSNPNFKGNNNQHTTLLSTSSFNALMRFIYTGEISLFGPLECGELLNVEDGVNFYFATSKSQEVVDLKEILEENINKVTKENCLPTLLYALNENKEELKELCFSVFQDDSLHFIEEIKSNFELKEQNLLSLCVLTFYAKQSLKK